MGKSKIVNFLFSVILLVLIFTPFYAHAYNYIWDGDSSSRWTTANNWDRNSSYPGYYSDYRNEDTATINSNKQNPILISVHPESITS